MAVCDCVWEIVIVCVCVCLMALLLLGVLYLMYKMCYNYNTISLGILWMQAFLHFVPVIVAATVTIAVSVTVVTVAVTAVAGGWHLGEGGDGDPYVSRRPGVDHGLVLRTSLVWLVSPASAVA